MSSFEAFSMPLRTPFSIIRYVAIRMISVQKTGLIGSWENVVKYSLMYSGLPNSLPETEAHTYSRHHPETTA